MNKAIVLLLLAGAVWAQPVIPAKPVHFVIADPTGPCGNSYITVNTITGAITVCKDGIWAAGGSGSGISACPTTPPTTGTAGQVCVTGTSQYLCHTTGACSVAGDWTLVGPSGLDILRFSICITAGCGSETTINYIATMGAGTFTECSFNLATAATGSSVIVDVQDATGTSIFGATKLVAPQSSTSVVYQGTFANSPQTYARGSKYKAVVLNNDPNGAAQGGAVQCR